MIEPVPLQLTLFSLLKPPEVILSTDTKIHRAVLKGCTWWQFALRILLVGNFLLLLMHFLWFGDVRWFQ